jgi:hypothetical protein
MDKGTRLKILLGGKISDLEKELMPFLELQDTVELTEKEMEFIRKQHMIARMMRDNIMVSIENQTKISPSELKEVKKNAQATFDLIMKSTYDLILESIKKRK